MPENNHAEELRLFELDDHPTPAEQVDTFIEEHAELFVYTTEAWATAIEAEKSTLVLFDSRHARTAQRRIEREANPKQEGWRIFETHMLNGQNADLTDLTDRMAYAKAVTERYCEQAVTMLSDNYTLGSRLGNRTIQTADELQMIQQSIIAHAQVACAYGMAFFAQTEAKRRLMQLADSPQTAEALLERIQKEAADPEPTPGLLEIIATDTEHQTEGSIIHNALMMQYADTPAWRSQILQEWIASDQLPRRLRQETVAALLVMQLIAKDVEADENSGARVAEIFAQKFKYWPPQLQTDYKDRLQSQKASSLKDFTKLLEQYVRRSRLPDTRAFRKASKR